MQILSRFKSRFVLFSFTLMLVAAAAKTTLLFIDGYIRGLLKDYNALEIKEIDRDLDHIRKLVFKNTERVSAPDLIYLASGGAPLTRKSTTLEYYLATNPRYAKLAYIDPDTRSLFFMSNTYLNSLSYLNLTKYNSMVEAKRAAYEKWRWASNYIANTLLEEAFAPDSEGKRVSIAHGTTLSGEAVGGLLSNVKNAGYRIELILCAANEDVRLQALDYRTNEQKVVQVTPEDMINKAGLFVERIPVHFAHADKIYIHYTTDIKDQYEAAAVLDFGAKKTIQIKHKEKYDLFVQNYKKLAKKNAPSWGTLTKDFVNQP